MAGLAQLARDPLVAGEQALASIDQQHQQVRAGNRSPALLDDQLMQRIFALATTGRASASRVVPATGATMARRLPVMRLKSVDLPTFGRPARTTAGDLRDIDIVT